jgi:hypothetical protein
MLGHTNLKSITKGVREELKLIWKNKRVEEANRRSFFAL